MSSVLISYHLTQNGHPGAYSEGFRIAPLNDFKRIANGISQYVWSGIAWRDGVRKEQNFRASDWAVLDFDNGELELLTAVENIFCDMQHIIGTTRSHQKWKGSVPPCDRFRVMIPWEQRVTRIDMYRASMERLVGKFVCDKACKDGARFFFPCTEIVSINDSADAYLQETRQPEKPVYSYIRKDSCCLSRWAVGMLRISWPEGTRNTTVYRLSIELARIGNNFDEIYQLIVNNPTFTVSPLSDQLRREITATIKSGIKKGTL